MRHQKRKFTLGRTLGPRRALLKTLSVSLITHGRIQTTPVKARFVRKTVERAITKGKINSPQSIRHLLKVLGNKQAALKVVNEVSPKFAKRNGGYTRMTKVGIRKGDGAEQVIIEFVD